MADIKCIDIETEYSRLQHDKIVSIWLKSGYGHINKKGKK